MFILRDESAYINSASRKAACPIWMFELQKQASEQTPDASSARDEGSGVQPLLFYANILTEYIHVDYRKG